MFGKEPNGARLRVKSFSHDFGTYYEVVCRYDLDNPEAYEYALDCDRGLGYWTAIGLNYMNEQRAQDTENEYLRQEIYDRISQGDYDISDIFDGDIADLI